MQPSDIFGVFGPVLDELHLGVLVVDREGLIVYYNRRMAEIDELTPEEMRGYRISEVYSVTDDISPTMIALSTRRPVRGDLMQYKTARGRQINSLNHAFPLFDRGELCGAICLVTDVSSLTRQLMSGPKKYPDRLPRVSEGKVRFGDILGKNPVFREAVDVAKVAATGPSPVMLIGETGTGKDLFAKAIHDYGPRADKPFMAINCSAIPEALLEGILFGTTKGAFTGAVEKEGLFEHASGGTVFLDEINSMPMTLQAKLLRVMQDHRVRRVGGLTEKTVDLRIISASNINPLEALAAKSLRPDLYYRLGVIQVTIPPLRERPEDIPPLIEHFINKVAGRLGKSVAGVSDEVFDSLMRRPWPGNVRELEHAIESALNFVSDGERLSIRHLKRASRHAAGRRGPEPGRDEGRREEAAAAVGESGRGPEVSRPGLDWNKPLNEMLLEVERRRVLEALLRSRGHITKAALELGISSQLLGYKIKKLGLKTNPFQ